MSELNRLLGFMSSWDRQAAMEKYTSLFASCGDPEALMEELGTPTRLAIELAGSYVPTPSPARLAPEVPEEQSEEDEPAGEAAEQPEQIAWDLSPEPEAAPTPTKTVVKTGALIAYLIPAVLIGLPIAVLLICLGLPFLAAGAGVIGAAVSAGLKVIAALSLVSDILLASGAALILCAVGLVLCWLGLWLSMELCWLWADKVLVALGRKLCVKEVPAA